MDQVISPSWPITFKHEGPRTCRRAFTLVELLAVLFIISILAVLVTPSIVTMLRGNELSRAGQMAGDALSLARQDAVSNNQEVYVLFFKIPNSQGTLVWRALQLAYVNRDGTSTGIDTGPAVTPIGKLIILPEAVEFSTATYQGGASYSPLLTTYSVTGTRKLPNISTTTAMKWQGFRFRADGSLDRGIKQSMVYLTVVSSNDNGVSPKNYYTVQMNSVTGLVRVFRP